MLGLALAQARAASAVPTTYRDHMEMTLPHAQRSGDRERADAILAAARQVMAQYSTVAAAEAAGFKKFLPGVPLPIEHYTNRRYAVEAWLGHFDPMHPTSLIFKRDGDSLQIVGVQFPTNALDTKSDGIDVSAALSDCVPRVIGVHWNVPTPLASAASAGRKAWASELVMWTVPL